MKKIKVGVIGLGTISAFHIEAYKNNPNVELTAFCDINMERARLKANEFEVRQVYDDYKVMLKDSGIDAVSVITTTNTHADVVIDALEAGIHVLCEKPPALNAAEAIRMQEASRRSGKLLMFGLVRRFAQNAQVLREYLHNGEFGDVYYVKTGFLRRCGNPGGWFANKSISGGGPLIDIGVHIIDLAMFLMGNPKPVEVLGNVGYKVGARTNVKGVTCYRSSDSAHTDNGVEDFANAIVRFDNGSSLFVETSWAMHIKSDRLYFELFGEKGGAMLEPNLEIYGEQNDYMVDIKPVLDNYSFDFKKSFGAEIDHFADCILNGRECMCSAEDGVKVMKVIDAIYQSAKEGRAVNLSA